MTDARRLMTNAALPALTDPLFRNSDRMDSRILPRSFFNQMMHDDYLIPYNVFS